MDNLFSTHPATDNRIAALEAMASRRRQERRRTRRRPCCPADPWRTVGPHRSAAAGAAEAPGRTLGPQSDRAARARGREPIGRANPPAQSSAASPQTASLGAGPCRAAGRGKAARRRHRRAHAARRPHRSRTRPSPVSRAGHAATGPGARHPGHRAAPSRRRSRRLIAARLDAAAAANGAARCRISCSVARRADPVPRRARQRCRRPRRHPCQGRSAHGALRRPGQRRAARPRARQGDDPPAELAATADAPAWFARPARGAAYGRRGRRSDPRRATGSKRRSISPSRPTRALGGQASAASFCRPAPSGSQRLAARGCRICRAFAEGAWWVQDAAAALPARLLGDVAGLRVADLCAAPGGKTAQLAAAGAQVTAVDQSAQPAQAPCRKSRAARARSRDRCRPTPANARPAQRFDAVLLDAPCSVDRHGAPPPRHPLDKNARATSPSSPRCSGACSTMRWHLVKPGGRIVFANCSLDPPKKARRWSTRFLAERAAERRARPDSARRVPGAAIYLDARRPAAHHARRSRPRRAGTSGLDGFFAARFRCAATEPFMTPSQ